MSPEILETLSSMIERIKTLEAKVAKMEGKRTPKPSQVATTDGFYEALDYMAEVTGRKFRASAELSARLKDYSLDEVKQVILYKAKEWMNTPSQKYLRPQTLFNRNKFEGYLNDSQQLVPTELPYENRPQANVIDNNQLGWSNSGAS